MGNEGAPRTNGSLNKRIEQDHRGIKQRSYPMRGLGTFTSAARFSRGFDEICQYVRPRSREHETRSLAQQRQVFWERLTMLQELLDAASYFSKQSLRGLEDLALGFSVLTEPFNIAHLSSGGS